MQSVSGQVSHRVAGTSSDALRSQLFTSVESLRTARLTQDVETLKFEAAADPAAKSLLRDIAPRAEHRGPISPAAQSLSQKLESIATRPFVLEKYRGRKSARQLREFGESSDKDDNGVVQPRKHEQRPLELEEALCAIRTGAWNAEDYGASMALKPEVAAVGDTLTELAQRKERAEVRKRVETASTAPEAEHTKSYSAGYLAAACASSSASASPHGRSTSPPPSAPLADAVSLLHQRVSKLREQVLCLQEENHNLKLDAERRVASEKALEEENRLLRTELSELSHASRDEVQQRARRAAFVPGRRDVATVDSLDHSLRASRKLDNLLYEQSWRAARTLDQSLRDARHNADSATRELYATRDRHQGQEMHAAAAATSASAHASHDSLHHLSHDCSSPPEEPSIRPSLHEIREGFLWSHPRPLPASRTMHAPIPSPDVLDTASRYRSPSPPLAPSYSYRGAAPADFSPSPLFTAAPGTERQFERTPPPQPSPSPPPPPLFARSPRPSPAVMDVNDFESVGSFDRLVGIRDGLLD